MVDDTPILPARLTRACVRRKDKVLVGPIDHEISPQGLTIVLGPNGAGKTSFLRMLHGLERLTEGTVTWNVPDAQARNRQAYVFQTPVVMRRSAVENVAYPLTIHGTRRAAALARARDALDRVGLADLAERPATVLSGGERQKLALARALIRQPEILFLDEPCSNLDGRSVRDIEAILRRTRAEGTRIVMATHDLGQARRLAEDVLFIYRGRLHEAAPAGVFFNAPQTPESHAFLNGDILE